MVLAKKNWIFAPHGDRKRRKKRERNHCNFPLMLSSFLGLVYFLFICFRGKRELSLSSSFCFMYIYFTVWLVCFFGKAPFSRFCSLFILIHLFTCIRTLSTFSFFLSFRDLYSSCVFHECVSVADVVHASS